MDKRTKLQNYLLESKYVDAYYVEYYTRLSSKISSRLAARLFK